MNVERLLRDGADEFKGDTPPNAKDGFPGLRSPKWPNDILPPIDQKLAAQGAELYKDPLPGMSPPRRYAARRFYDFNNKNWWTRNEAGEPILKVENIPISAYRDRSRAGGRHDGPNRRGARKSRDQEQQLRVRAGRTWSRRPSTPSSTRRNRRRAPRSGSGSTDICRTNSAVELAYKVRPLNGIWATPPYLHNGSVPTIEDLLGDPEKRPPTFYLGSREYDPVKLGYKTDPITNGFKFDTSIRGNSNRGHEFRKDFSKDKEIKGVIGPELSEGDRKALIEYLKTL